VWDPRIRLYPFPFFFYQDFSDESLCLTFGKPLPLFSRVGDFRHQTVPPALLTLVFFSALGFSRKVFPYFFLHTQPCSSTRVRIRLFFFLLRRYRKTSGIDCQLFFDHGGLFASPALLSPPTALWRCPIVCISLPLFFFLAKIAPFFFRARAVFPGKVGARFNLGTPSPPPPRGKPFSLPQPAFTQLFCTP